MGTRRGSQAVAADRPERSERAVGDERPTPRPARDEHGAERTARLFARRDDPAAREELIRTHSGLAASLARRFVAPGQSPEDLVQVAMVGLIKAVDRFDPSRGTSFSTYASATVSGELKRHLRDTGWALRVPRRLQERGLQLRRVQPELCQDLGRAPSVVDLAERTLLNEDDVRAAMAATTAYSAVSLDAPLDADGNRWADRLGTEDGRLEDVERWMSVLPSLRRLPRRERRILYLRFVRGSSQGEIAQDVGISQMHVSRLLAETLNRLRSAVEGSPDRRKASVAPGSNGGPARVAPSASPSNGERRPASASPVARPAPQHAFGRAGGPPDHRRSAAGGPADGFGQRRILVVEDEDRVASFLVKGLRAAGYAVERAARGEEALARMHSEDPELVILDLGLPDIDGSEVVRRYRASAGQVPVIILSARGDVGDRVAALELGADDYMCKPFAFDELLARIKVRLRDGDRSGILRAG